MNIITLIVLLLVSFVICLFIFAHYEKRGKGDVIGLITFFLLLGLVLALVVGGFVGRSEKGWEVVSEESVTIIKVNVDGATYVGEDGETHTSTGNFISCNIPMKKVKYEKWFGFLVWTKEEFIEQGE